MLYTIGYSNRPLPEFIRQLADRQITQLIDVRSSPWSRYAPYNLTRIPIWSEKAGILYRYEGELLGGRSEIDREDARYQHALRKIVRAASNENVAIMCAEGDPAQCHRTWDIAAYVIMRFGAGVISVLRDGSDEPIVKTLRRVSRSRFRSEILTDIDGLLTGQGAFWNADGA